jgi:hypothetical protein
MNISSYLKASPELAAVTQHAERLIALQHLFEAVAPPALARQCRVANFKQGKLVIHAANAFIAAKLRQMLPSLSDEFSNRGWQITAIQVAVQDQQPAPRPTEPLPSPPSPAARAGLAEFARSADPRLRDAVEHLLAVASPSEDHHALKDQQGKKDRGKQDGGPE